MYLFAALALPLGFILLYIRAYPDGELAVCRREFLRGLILSPFAWVLSGILGSILPDFLGSAFLILSEWVNRTLPFAGFPLLGYMVFHHLDERLPPGVAERRMTAFLAGCLAPFGIAEAARSWQSPDLYLAILLPIVTAGMALSSGRAALGIALEYGFRRGIRIAALIVASLAAATPRWLMLSGLWPLAILVVGLVAGISWLYAGPALFRRAPAPLDA